MKPSLEQKVLRCVGERPETAAEIFKKYSRTYPPSMVGKVLSFRDTEKDISNTLNKLTLYGFVLKSVTRWLNEEPLLEDVAQYQLADKGRVLLLKKAR